MVSKASELLPEPESPVTTVSALRGIRTLMSRKLCWRAPRTEMCVMDISGLYEDGGYFGVLPNAHSNCRTTHWGYSIRQQKQGSTRHEICDNRIDDCRTAQESI